MERRGVSPCGLNGALVTAPGLTMRRASVVRGQIRTLRPSGSRHLGSPAAARQWESGRLPAPCGPCCCRLCRHPLPSPASWGWTGVFSAQAGEPRLGKAEEGSDSPIRDSFAKPEKGVQLLK